MAKTAQRHKQSGELEVYRGIRALSRASKLSRPTLAKHLHEIEHRRISGVVLVTRDALQRWLEGHDAAPDEAA